MARVNHKRVKELLNEKRSKITDRQFFTSRILAGHFEDMAAAQTRRYHYRRRVRVHLFWDPKDGNVACTNDASVLINAGHKLITKYRSRTDRYDRICGLFAHELGHILFTDFLAGQTYNNFLASYRWYPAPPILKTGSDAKNEKAFWEYVKADPKNLEMVQYLLHHLANILEDGYIEARMLNQFPGVLGYSLDLMRKTQYEEMLTVSQMEEREDDGTCHIFETILQIMLSYVKYGEIKYGDASMSDERIQVVFKLIPELDSAVMDSSAKNRWQVVSLIAVRCWEYLESFLDICKQRQEEAAAAGGESSAARTLAEMLQSIAGTSTEGEGSGTPVAGAESASCTEQNGAARAQTRALAAANQSEEEESSPGESGEEAESPNESEDGEKADTICSKTENGEEPGGKDAAASVDSGLKGDGRGDGKNQEVTSEEQGRIPLQQTARVSEPQGGEVEYDDDYRREHYDRAASDIERMLEEMAERAACKQAENERIQELNDVAQSVSYGNVHSGISIRVNRVAEVSEEQVEQYDTIAGPLLAISRQLQKNLIQQLRDQQRGGKMTNLIMGRRIEAHALCRNDGKVFYKNNLPNEIPRLSVALLLDESGSMCSCDRATYARAAAIILYDFCQALQIPVMVYGHSTDCTADVDLYSYSEFDSIDRNDKYRMMDISARGSNRDGAALRFVAEQLSKRTEDVRILILVSDGQPAASGYYGTAAEEDLRGIKQEYRRKGLLFIAAAIGDDKQNIERIYGDSFLDITDLNQLPAKLTSVVKRFVRV